MLQKIHTDEMDEIFKDKKDLIGYPLFWDVTGKVWSNPLEGIEIIYDK